MFSQIKDTKHIRQDFYSVTWVMPQGWDFGALGVPGRSQIHFFKHGHVAYQIDGDDEQNRMQVKFSSQGQTGDLGTRSKGKISLNFGYCVNLNDFIPNYVFSQIKDRKHIEQNFFLFPWSCPRMGLGGAGGGVKTLAWGFAMAPHRLCTVVLVLFDA